MVADGLCKSQLCQESVSSSVPGQTRQYQLIGFFLAKGGQDKSFFEQSGNFYPLFSVL